MSAALSSAGEDDLVTCLARAAAWRDAPPRLVTLSERPARPRLDVAFGAGASLDIVVDDTHPFADQAAPDPARHAVLARFLEPRVLDEVSRSGAAWLARCAAVITHFDPELGLVERLTGCGFTSCRQFAATQGAARLWTPPPPPAPPPGANSRPARPRLGRLVIVDPCLGLGRGHYLSHARLLTEGATAFGARTIWAAHRGLNALDVPAGVEARSWFERCFIDFDLAAAPATDLSAELLDGWLKIADAFGQPDTHLLMHSADGHMLRAAADFASARPAFAGAVHLLLHVDPRHLAGRALREETHRTLVRLRRCPQWERSLYLWAENARLAGWLSEWLSAAIPTAPALVRAAEPRPQRRDEGLVVAALGESRASKGFLDLPAIAAAIDADPVLRVEARLVAQWWPPVGRDLRDHEAAVAALRRYPFVEIIEGAMPDDEYRRRLAEADALLFPYDPKLYRLRGSGVLLEALARGALLIVRAGTALEQSAAEGVSFIYHKPAELPAILHRIARRRGPLAESARRRAARFARLNGPERLVRALDLRARDTWPAPSASRRDASPRLLEDCR